MNKVLLVCAMVLFTTTTIAEEKSITPQEFGNAIAETPGKLVNFIQGEVEKTKEYNCLLYTSPSQRDRQKSRMPSSA